MSFINTIPDAMKMGLAYLPSKLASFLGVNVGKYTIHGSYRPIGNNII